jgi:hypothetical protein
MALIVDSEPAGPWMYAVTQAGLRAVPLASPDVTVRTRSPASAGRRHTRQAASAFPRGSTHRRISASCSRLLNPLAGPSKSWLWRRVCLGRLDRLIVEGGAAVYGTRIDQLLTGPRGHHRTEEHVPLVCSPSHDHGPLTYRALGIRLRVPGRANRPRGHWAPEPGPSSPNRARCHSYRMAHRDRLAGPRRGGFSSSPGRAWRPGRSSLRCWF